jgi:hypothetical protein
MRILSLLFLIVCFVSKSQNNSSDVFLLKPSLGFNVCQIHGDAYDGYDKLGGFAGISVNARFNKKASVELGFYFSQKGARHNSNPDKGDYSFYRLNLNYIDLPLSFHYKLNPVYFATAGPSLAYLINYNEIIDYVDKTGLYHFNDFEIGINAGLGRKIKNKFYVEVRSSNSIRQIRDYGIKASGLVFPNPVARFFNKGLYNNILTLLVSYKLDFRKRNGKQES